MGLLRIIGKNVLMCIGVALVIAGFFIVPYFIVPGLALFPLSPLIPLVIELVIVNCTILAGVALIIKS